MAITQVGRGGGIANWNSHSTMINCTLLGNVAGSRGGALRNIGGIQIVTNCIFSGNLPEEIDNNLSFNTEVHVAYSNIVGRLTEGVIDLGGNIDADPLFIDPSAGDLRLKPGSPCIDAGDNLAVPEGVATDLDGNPRFIDDPDSTDTGNGASPIVDMGAYEFQPSCPADVFPPPNGNGYVGLGDLLFVIFNWGTPAGDTDGDGDTDVFDLLTVLQSWGLCD